MCIHARSFLTLAAAEPWPENATLYQPLRGKSGEWIDDMDCLYDYQVL